MSDNNSLPNKGWKRCEDRQGRGKETKGELNGKARNNLTNAFYDVIIKCALKCSLLIFILISREKSFIELHYEDTMLHIWDIEEGNH